MACRQGTLTPPNTWTRPFGTCICSTCWDQCFSELVVIFLRTMLFEYPSLLSNSRFCFMTPRWPLWLVCPRYWPQNVTGSLEVVMSYFMTPSFGDLYGRLTYFISQKGHVVIKGRLHILYDPKGHSDVCGLFNLVYDSKISLCHWRSPWPTLWPRRSR